MGRSRCAAFGGDQSNFSQGRDPRREGRLLAAARLLLPLLQLEIPPQILERGDLPTLDVLSRSDEAALKRRIALLVPRVAEVLGVFVVSDADEDRGRNARALDEKALAAVRQLVQEGAEVVAEVDRGDFFGHVCN